MKKNEKINLTLSYEELIYISNGLYELGFWSVFNGVTKGLKYNEIKKNKISTKIYNSIDKFEVKD